MRERERERERARKMEDGVGKNYGEKEMREKREGGKRREGKLNVRLVVEENTVVYRPPQLH